MSLHRFTLIVDGPDVQQQALVDALFEAGCDDGLVGRSEGIQYIEFDRDASGLDVAVLSAAADVEKVPGVTVARIADARPHSLTGTGTGSNGPHSIAQPASAPRECAMIPTLRERVSGRGRGRTGAQ